LPGEVGQLREKLMDAARQTAERAYCPYSRFRVGAAVWTVGKLYGGCNVENASYGLAMCAERVAIFNAISAGHSHIEALAVCCLDAQPQAPDNYRMCCGACRQVMSEFADENFVIYIDGVGDFHLPDLLPRPFQLHTEPSAKQ